MNEKKISDLLGKTLLSIKGKKGDERMELVTSDGSIYAFYHSQDCCESVGIEDVIGDLGDLIGEPLLEAEEATSNENPAGYVPEYQESCTWTFYKLGTRKGSVTIRWLGESNGYYSESVDFVCLLEAKSSAAHNTEEPK